MIEEIKIDGILYKISENKEANCLKCDLGQFCDRNMDFCVICLCENDNRIFKKQ